MHAGSWWGVILPLSGAETLSRHLKLSSMPVQPHTAGDVNKGRGRSKSKSRSQRKRQRKMEREIKERGGPRRGRGKRNRWEVDRDREPGIGLIMRWSVPCFMFSP